MPAGASPIDRMRDRDRGSGGAEAVGTAVAAVQGQRSSMLEKAARVGLTESWHERLGTHEP
jgi:hypothetical protein